MNTHPFLQRMCLWESRLTANSALKAVASVISGEHQLAQRRDDARVLRGHISLLKGVLGQIIELELVRLAGRVLVFALHNDTLPVPANNRVSACPSEEEPPRGGARR